MARTAGPAPGGSTTPRARCTASSTARRVRPARSTPTASARRRCCCRTSSGQARRCCASLTALAGARRAHGAARVLRRHPGEERRGRARRAHPARAGGPPRRAMAAPRRRVRAGRRRPRATCPPTLPAQWLAARPGTDAALMLALCHVLHRRRPGTTPRSSRPTARALDDALPYLSGAADGVAEVSASGRRRSPASPAGTIRGLARRMAGPPHDGRGDLVAAARRVRRAAGVGGGRCSRRCSARSGCPAAGSATATGRWLTTAVPSNGMAAAAAAVDQPGARPSSPSPGSRTCCSIAGATYAYNGRAAPLPAHRARVLVRRQPVPPPPGPRPAAHGVGAAPSTVVVHEPYWTADRAARRHRPPGHRDAGARRHRRRRAPTRSSPPCTRPPPRTRRPATTTTIFSALAESLGAAKAYTEGRDAAAGCATSTSGWRAAAAAARRTSTRSGAPAASSSPDPAAGRPARATSAPTRPPTRSPPRAGGSSCTPPPSRRTATTTARDTPSGWSRWSGTGPRGRGRSRSSCSRTTPRRGCTASSTSGRTARTSKVAWPRAGPDAPRRRRRARSGRRGSRPGLQRPGRLPRRPASSTPASPLGVVQMSTGAWLDPVDRRRAPALRGGQRQRARRPTSDRRASRRAAREPGPSCRSRAGPAGERRSSPPDTLRVSRSNRRSARPTTDGR